MIYTMPGLNLDLNAESIEANPRRELNLEKKKSVKTHLKNSSRSNGNAESMNNKFKN